MEWTRLALNFERPLWLRCQERVVGVTPAGRSPFRGLLANMMTQRHSCGHAAFVVWGSSYLPLYPIISIFLFQLKKKICGNPS